MMDGPKGAIDQSLAERFVKRVRELFSQWMRCPKDALNTSRSIFGKKPIFRLVPIRIDFLDFEQIRDRAPRVLSGVLPRR